MDEWRDKFSEQELLIYDFLKENKIDIEDVIDVIIKVNRLVGVGLVSLEEHVVKAIKKHHRHESFEQLMR
jgi:hypothetical protein|tara:strand:- start:874 stop:1083 length:210 start_codon:yes stop_codon:yes gene_type:complete